MQSIRLIIIYYMIMKYSENAMGGADYMSPVCTPVEISSEGILCESFRNESFKGMGENDSAPSYGTGLTDNGWY